MKLTESREVKEMSTYNMFQDPTEYEAFYEGYAEGKEKVMNEIRQILVEYFNNTDLLHGSDENYVIARIADLVGYNYEIKDVEKSGDANK